LKEAKIDACSWSPRNCSSLPHCTASSALLASTPAISTSFHSSNWESSELSKLKSDTSNLVPACSRVTDPCCGVGCGGAGQRGCSGQASSQPLGCTATGKGRPGGVYQPPSGDS
jgi:hypothetical protein